MNARVSHRAAGMPLAATVPTITIFRARDGRWSYCPAQVRSQLAFSFRGQFATWKDALAAVHRDTTIPTNVDLIIE